MHCELVSDPLNPYETLEQYDQHLRSSCSSIGACANFIGNMRDVNDSKRVKSMLLEHYPGMTEKELKRVANDACKKWDLVDVLLLHRVGRVYPNDAIVVIGTWSIHRADAFESCRYIMEILKSDVPIWKKEQRIDGEYWISKNTKGYTENSF
tara:strand:- start:127 stop:582 length:456 start_codon:yes stop_codon:yes gene_type:complete